MQCVKTGFVFRMVGVEHRTWVGDLFLGDCGHWHVNGIPDAEGSDITVADRNVHAVIDPLPIGKTQPGRYFSLLGAPRMRMVSAEFARHVLSNYSADVVAKLPCITFGE
jgi:hypothetical protein